MYRLLKIALVIIVILVNLPGLHAQETIRPKRKIIKKENPDFSYNYSDEDNEDAYESIKLSDAQLLLNMNEFSSNHPMNQGDNENFETTDNSDIYECNKCYKTFATCTNLKRHNKIHDNIKNFKCAVCDKLFREKHHLVIHFRIHTGEKPYSCTKCHKSFSDKSNCYNHMKTHK